MSHKRRKTSFSLAEKCGFLALASAIPLFFIARPLALVSLLLFLLLCAVAPFLVSFGFYLPIISRGRREEKGIALTFDDGPDSTSTPVILELLARYNLQATFFVVGTRAAAHPELIKKILDQGHTIGNHSWDHDYYLMLRSPVRLRESIAKTQETLKLAGITPHVFRPPMGITGSRLGDVLDQEGLIAVNYSCTALDKGNRQIDNLARKILGKLRPGDIIILHDLPPAGTDKMLRWKKELEHLFETLTKKHTTIPLAQSIGHPVMTTNDSISNVSHSR